MKQFIKSLFIIISITFVIDRGLSYVVRALYSTTTTTDEYKINAVTFQMNDPIVFMGSSRSHHHYVPFIITDSLNAGVYNAGLWGMRNIYFQYALLSNILERYTPTTICLEIHPIDYLKTPFSTTETVNILAPFINYSDGCDEMLKKSGVYYKARLFHMIRYNSLLSNLLLGNLSQRSFATDKGFKPLFGQLDTISKEILPEEFLFPVDEDKAHYLQAFIDKCKEKKINLIILYSPMYAVEKTNLFDFPEYMAKKNNIPFINYYNLKGLTGHSEYYYDFGHLNARGAEKYSSVIASDLKKHIKN